MVECNNINGNYPFFSIITPVFNREVVVINCIESILNQTFLDFESIVINDGSTDNTLTVLKKYESEKSSKTKVISYKNNKGANYARNRGIEAARGEFIIFLDSDDYFISQNSLSLIKKYISENAGYDHYLFRINYREEDILLPNDLKETKI